MDSTTTYIIFAGLGLSVFFIAIIGGIIFVLMQPRMRLKKRLDMIGTIGAGTQKIAGRAESRRQKRIQDKVKQLADAKEKKGWAETVRINLLQAGINADAKTYVMASIISGVIVSVLYLFFGMPKAGAIPVGVLGALVVPKFVLGYLAKGRQADFTSHFAEAIDVVVRGIRSGLPVSECLLIIGREFPGPVGEEFRMIVEGQNLGLPLEDIMAKGLERIPTPEYKFFAIVLQIQKQTGGNLADTLEGLTNVLRDRKKMKDKVQALASESKSSAAIIASLPFFVMGMLSIMNPSYLMLLFTEEMGNYMLYAGGFWMMCGILVMNKMINFEF